MKKLYSIKEISFSELQVDIKNPRLPKSQEFPDSDSVFKYLLKNGDIYPIAVSIAENGMFPNEQLIAIQENGSYIVVEGNRRYVAIKLLLNPALADHESKKYTDLANGIEPDDLSTLNVIVYESRVAVAPVLLKRHTNDPAKIKPWDPLMKAHYTASFVDGTSTVKEVADSLNAEEERIREDLSILQLYNLAKALKLPAEIKNKVTDEKKFPITNLERAVNSSAGKELFAFTSDENGILSLSYSSEEFYKPYKRLIFDIAEGHFDSRKQNSNSQIAAYFEAYIAEEKPNQSKTGSEKINDLIEQLSKPETDTTATPGAEPTTGSGPGPTVPPASGPSAGPRTGPTSGSGAPTPPGTTPPPTSTPKPPSPPVRKRGKSIMYADIKPNHNHAHPRILKVMSELKSIEADKFPNSAGVLLRVLIEISTYEHLKRHGVIATMTAEETAAKIRHGQTLRQFWTPDLQPMILRACKDYAICGLNEHVAKGLEKHIVKGDVGSLIYFLNEIVHNPAFIVRRDDVVDIYDKFEPYFKEVL